MSRFARFFRLTFTVILISSLSGCDVLLHVLENAESPVDLTPSTTEMIAGLKEALVNGTGTATNILSKEGGYLNDPTVHIPFPPEAQFAADKIRDIGLGSLVDNFEARLNEGAEKGAQLALPIFKNAITGMSITDAKNILITKQQDAATQYFQRTTNEQLYNAFAPEIKKVLDEVNATQLWSDITTAYNKIPFTQKKIETDLVRYATDKALEGLFMKVALEEGKIRDDINARTSDLLKKVFGYADDQLSAGGQ